MMVSGLSFVPKLGSEEWSFVMDWPSGRSTFCMVVTIHLVVVPELNDTSRKLLSFSLINKPSLVLEVPIASDSHLSSRCYENI
jgi:hypothetical protein